MKTFLKNIIIWIITWEARMILKRYKPSIVAITGSVGKTSTKDAIYTALASTLYVQKSQKTLNSEFGVPLSIIGKESGWNNPFKWLGVITEGLLLLSFKNHYPKWLVLEVGADKPGDIQAITTWLKPDIAVITGVPDMPAHLEFFDSHEQVAREKAQLAHALKPEGTLILNGDDEVAYAMREIARAQATTYGFDHHNHYRASNDEILYEQDEPVGIRVRIDVKDGVSSIPVSTRGAVGAPQVYPLLAAVAVAHAAGIDFVTAGAALKDHVSPPGRMRVLRGIKQTTIIDDSYNSSPAALLAALNTLRIMNVQGRKIVALGDMRELGEYSKKAHRLAGELAAQISDIIITAGQESRELADAALSRGFPEKNLFQYDYGESQKAGKELELMLENGDVVLVKGSQNMIRMEKLVKEIMAEPERAPELLVRQNPEWLSRP